VPSNAAVIQFLLYQLAATKQVKRRRWFLDEQNTVSMDCDALVLAAGRLTRIRRGLGAAAAKVLSLRCASVRLLGLECASWFLLFESSIGRGHAVANTLLHCIETNATKWYAFRVHTTPCLRV
jgi:hypothetical protein